MVSRAKIHVRYLLLMVAVVITGWCVGYWRGFNVGERVGRIVGSGEGYAEAMKDVQRQ